MRYHNLDVSVGKQSGDAYPVRVVCQNDHGAHSGGIESDLSRFKAVMAQIENGAADGTHLVEFGKQLYAVLFPEESGLKQQFLTCVDALKTKEEGVRLRLQFDREAPEITAVPWEFLYKPTPKMPADGVFLGTSVKTPLVRYLDLPGGLPKFMTPLPLHMLVVIPTDHLLDTATERRILEEATGKLQQEGALKVTWLDGAVTRDRLWNAMLEEDHHIFHFIGHGTFKQDRPSLVLNGAGHAKDKVDASFLTRLFSNHLTMKLVVLNSCKGATLSPRKPFAGLAPQLVGQGVAAVVAMQYSIYDDEAHCFADKFYRSLLRSREKGRVDVAMTRARNALWAFYEDRRAVGVPVLYLRAPDGILFDIVSENPLENFPLFGAEADTANLVKKTYERNIERTRDPRERAENRVHLRRVKRLLTLRKLTLATAALIALLVMWAAALKLFDKLPPQFKPETYIIELSGWLNPTALDSAVALVGFDQEWLAEEGLEPIEESGRIRLPKESRGKHAEVVEALARAGAKVIAFALTFPDTSRYDARFAEAIRNAQTRHGASVIVSVNEFDAVWQPNLAAPLREAVHGWGHSCMYLGLQPNNIPGNTVEVLVTYSSEPGPLPKTRRVLPALALQAYGLFNERPVFRPDPFQQLYLPPEDSPFIDELEVLPVEGEPPSQCDAIRKADRRAMMTHELTPLNALPIRSYADVLEQPADTLHTWFDEKLVLVGDELQPWTIARTFGTQERYSIQLIADTLNALLRGVFFRRMSYGYTFLIILLMALWGAWLGTRAVRRRWVHTGLVAASLGAYGAVGLWLYLGFSLLPNALYHVLAFLISYFVMRFIKKKWFR